MVGGLIEQAQKNEDLDSRVLEAYIHLCTAEAQEGNCTVIINMEILNGMALPVLLVLYFWYYECLISQCTVYKGDIQIP